MVLCSDRQWFFASTYVRRFNRQYVTWRPSTPSQPCNQTDHIAISAEALTKTPTSAGLNQVIHVD